MAAITGSDWSIWTNLAFLIPIYIAVENRLWMHAIFICMTTALSFAYHLSGGKAFATDDQMTALALIAVNAVLVLVGITQRGYHNQWLAIAVGTACIGLLLFYIENRWPNTHGLWHIISAAITVFCQLFFLSA